MRLTPLLVLTTTTLPAALAWDPLGHQTVGFLAQRYFTPQASNLINTLLGLDRDGHNSDSREITDIGDAAAWADTIRGDSKEGGGGWGGLPWSKNWHFVNPPGDDPDRHVCVVDYPSDCSKGTCIIGAIQNQTAIVLDASRPTMERRNATMFLLHFFGDLHQPLHATGFKYGGNGVRPVTWENSTTTSRRNSTWNLHAVWDSAIPRKLRGVSEVATPAEDKAAAVAWAGDLFARQQGAGVGVDDVCTELDGPRCVVGWAAESNALVCSHALKDGEAWVLKNDLSGEYYEENAAVVDARVGVAGVRLAAWMNAIARQLGGEGETEWHDLRR